MWIVQRVMQGIKADSVEIYGSGGFIVPEGVKKVKVSVIDSSNDVHAIVEVLEGRSYSLEGNVSEISGM